MSLYNLISTGSGEIINIFEWNGIDEIFLPPGYITSLNTTESIEIPIAYEDIESSSMDNILTDIFVGESYGSFNSKYIDTVAITANTLISKNIVNSGVIITSGSTEFSGSVNITGSLFINDKKIETLLNGTKYGKLAFNSGTDLNVEPPLASFRFPTDPNDWNVPVSRITMAYWNSWFIERNDTYEQLRNYVIKVAQVIVNADNSCVMTLRSETNPNTFKKFRIIGGTYYNYNFGRKTCSQINWGQRTFTPSPSINCDRFDEQLYRTENEQMWFDTWNTTDQTTDFWTKLIESQAYFELEVEELESNHEWKINGIPFDSQQQPNTAYYNEIDESENDWFWVDFEHDVPLGYKRKEVFEFTSTTTPWEVPAWADELTIYCIGAGGGGGGGASGHGLHPIRDFYEKSSVYVKSYNGVDFSNHKILLKNNLQLLSETDAEIEFMDKSGHIYVTGGGGGAGGNVAISKIKISDGLIASHNIGINVIPRRSKLNIYVGSGGKGGEGSSYKDDLNIDLFGGRMRDGIDSELFLIGDGKGNFVPTANAMRSSNWYLSRLGMKFTAKNYTDLQLFSESIVIKPSWNTEQYHPNSKDMSFYVDYFPSMPSPYRKSYYKKMTSNNVKHFGKRGGFSSVELSQESNTVTNTNIEMIRANGGYGGLAGWGLTTHSSDIHRLCASFGHQFQHFFIPGGGSSLDSTFGNIGVRPGGHGGYGISMPSIEKVPDPKILNSKRSYSFGDYPMNPIAEAEAKFRGYEYQYSRDYTRSTKMAIHIAPSIPWNSLTANNRFQTNEFGNKTLGYTLPWGSTVDVDYSNWENDGHRIYNTTSQLTPNLPAPLGGNGGIGVTWFGLDNSYAYDVYSIDESLNYFNYVGSNEPNGATVDFGNVPSYIERVLFSKINGVVITSTDAEDYFPPRDVFEVQQSNIAKNIIFDLDAVAIIEGSSTLVSTITRTTSKPNGYYSFDIGNQGAHGGFGVYQTSTKNYDVSFNNGGLEVPAENGRWYGNGGGGGAAAYVTDWNEKDTANVKGQDGANGAGGIVIIVAEEL